MRLLAIYGHKRSGKDTTARLLVDDHAFIKAQPFAVFKYALANWFGWDDRHLEGDLKEVVDAKYGFSPRRLLQIVGTELFKTDLGKYFPMYARNIGDAIWAEVFCDWLDRQDPDRNYVVSDLRFPEEQRLLEQRFPKKCTFIRVDAERSLRDDSHASESYYDDLHYDIHINNNGTVEDLAEVVDHIVYDIEGR